MGIPTMGFRVGSNKNKLKFPQYSLYLEIGWLQILAKKITISRLWDERQVIRNKLSDQLPGNLGFLK
jgi:hypothetical protein